MVLHISESWENFKGEQNGEWAVWGGYDWVRLDKTGCDWVGMGTIGYNRVPLGKIVDEWVGTTIALLPHRTVLRHIFFATQFRLIFCK